MLFDKLERPINIGDYVAFAFHRASSTSPSSIMIGKAIRYEPYLVSHKDTSGFWKTRTVDLLVVLGESGRETKVRSGQQILLLLNYNPTDPVLPYNSEAYDSYTQQQPGVFQPVNWKS